MAKKPVLGLAGVFLAGVALTGCQTSRPQPAFKPPAPGTPTASANNMGNRAGMPAGNMASNGQPGMGGTMTGAQPSMGGTMTGAQNGLTPTGGTGVTRTADWSGGRPTTQPFNMGQQGQPAMPSSNLNMGGAAPTGLNSPPNMGGATVGSGNSPVAGRSPDPYPPQPSAGTGAPGVGFTGDGTGVNPPSRPPTTVRDNSYPSPVEVPQGATSLPTPPQNIPLGR
jgi:hypothetical protein